MKFVLRKVCDKEIGVTSLGIVLNKFKRPEKRNDKCSGDRIMLM